MSMTCAEHAEREAIKAAARWYARLTSQASGEAEQRAWQHWLQADPLHQRAWQHVESVRMQMSAVPGKLAASTLSEARQSRRSVLRAMALLLGAGGLAELGRRSDAWLRLTAEYRTAVGERRHVVLADGSQLLLNTHSAVDELFDEHQRLLVLRAGEVVISTHHDTLDRPFRVQTAHGSVRALGTRFIVRTDATGSEVDVLEKAVEVSVPGGAATVRLEAGQHTRFDHQGIAAVQANDSSLGTWQQGSIVAVDKPLGELIDELGRYRPGWLSCAPSLRGLRVSGAFPVDDTDLALAALQRSFPVSVVYRTRYWVSVVPRS